VVVRQNGAGRIEVVGDYSGGREGASIFEWRAANPGDSPVSLGHSTHREFAPPPDLAGFTVEARYIPIRDDGERGHGVVSTNRLVVQPLPNVDMSEILSQTGHFTVGATLRCHAKVSHGHPVYQWYVKATTGGAVVIRPGATSEDYVISDDDVGLLVLCTVDPVNAQGWHGRTVAATITEPVVAMPVGLVIVSHKNRFRTGVEITTNTGQPVTWETESENEWIIALEDQVSYRLTPNDIGHRIRAFSGELESAPTPPIELRPQLTSFVRAAVRARTFKFTATGRVGRMRWLVIADDVGITMKGKTGEKAGKWSTVSFAAIPEEPAEMVLWLDRSCKFLITPAFPKDQRLTTTLGAHIRDFVCATLTEYAKAAAQ
jgi:hypothetical protein